MSPIKIMELLASKIPDVVSLAQGIPSFDTPEIVKRAAIKALNRGVVAKYSLTYGLLELRETIEQKLAEDKMFYDFEKEIIAVAGSIEGITASLIAIIEPLKDEIIIFSPDYTSYSEAIKVGGGKPVYVNLDEKNGWRIDFNDFKAKINSRTAAIMFSNPNNPTGTIFSKNDLLQIADLAEKYDAFIISDEVYKDFIYYDDNFTSSPQLRGGLRRGVENNPSTPPPTPPQLRRGGNNNFFSLAQIPELRKRIIRIFSLSKAYAMAGWRIGFLHSDEENISEILKIHDSLVTCAPVIAQHAAIAALDFGDKEISKFVNEFQQRREIICERLDELKDYFSYHKPAGSYFVFPEIKFSPRHKYDATATNTAYFNAINILNPRQLGSLSWQVALDLLYGAKVAVVPGQAFGPAGENHIRLSFGRSEKDIQEGMKRIKKYLANI